MNNCILIIFVLNVLPADHNLYTYDSIHAYPLVVLMDMARCFCNYYIR